MIGRRGFIGSILAAFAAPKLPIPVVEAVRGCAVSTNGVPFGLAFHRNAFLLAVEAPSPIVVNVISSHQFTFTDEDLKLSIDDFGERYLRPVMELEHQRMLDVYRRQVDFLAGIKL